MYLVGFFFFFSICSLRLSKAIWGAFCLLWGLVGFFAFFTLLLSFFYLMQEQNLATKENMDLKAFSSMHRVKDPLQCLAAISIYVKMQQDQGATVTPQTVKPALQNRLTSALRAFGASLYVFLVYHCSIYADGLRQIEKEGNKISVLLS